MTASTFAPSPERELPRRSARDQLRRLLRTPDLVAVVTIVIGASVLGTSNILGAPTFQDDEGTYTAQAVAVQDGDLAPYTYWYDHPPLGWIQLAGLAWLRQVVQAESGSDLEAMRFAIAVFYVASCALVFLVTRRIGTRLPFAILASAIFALSPLALELGRQVYLDSVSTTWLLVAFYFALSPQRALWHHISSGVFFALAVLSKLTAAILGPALLVAMLDRTGWRDRAFSLVGFLALGGLTIALYPVMALLRGELISGPGHVSLQDALMYQFVSRSGSGWIWEDGSHRSQLVGSWVAIDGYITIAGALAAVACLFARRTRWIPVALMCYSLPIVASQGYLPAMYIIAALPFLAIAIGAAADLTWRLALRTLRHWAPGARISSTMLIGLVIAAAVVIIPSAHWVERNGALLTQDRNADWRRTLAWAATNIPHDDVVLAPYSMWHDLNERGWNDPWTMIVLEKVDLDSQFAVEHPAGWRDIQWIVEGPTVAPNIENLDLREAGLAFEHSEIVTSFGEWNVRRVIPPIPE